MGEECRVADYFVVAGLPTVPKPESTDMPHLKSSHSTDPITDITVIFPSLGERCPEGYEILEKTPSGAVADLNHGSLHSPEVFLCYKRGRHKSPLVDIGVLYESKERVLEDSKIVTHTPWDRVANVNNSTSRIYLTYRRARPDMPANELVVTDVCVINETKFEKPPHAFCLIKKNLNKGVFGSAVYLCYKKSVHRANLVTYKPEVLSRYPANDHPDCPLPAAVPMFCMPMGVSLEVWPPQASQPALLFSTFVLTVADAAEKLYGAAVTFYERYPVEKLTQDQMAALESSMATPGKGRNSSKKITASDLASGSVTVNVNKCICILSHWPFFYCFERFLRFLHSMSCEGSHSVPIERYISHLLEDVPFPSPQRPRILIQLSTSTEHRLILAQPEDLPLPRSGAGFLELLENLSVEDILLVLLLVLTEHKILVHSLRANVLTAVVEAISMVIFPFKWQCPYIPLCPLGLSDLLHAPLPFLIGVDSRFFELCEPPADVVCVDLDTNIITMPEDKGHLTYKLLPKRPARILKSSLEHLITKFGDLKRSCRSIDCYDDTLDFQTKENEQRLQLEIQEAFLRFMGSALKGYRIFLQPITKPPTDRATDTKSLFDLAGFLKSRDKSYLKFLQMVTQTQMFIRFIEERSFVSDLDAGLAFFDECIEKVEADEAGCRLLELEESHKSERTVFIAPPEPVGLPEGKTYSYTGFELNAAFFKHVDTKSRLQVPSSSVAPGSPLARRTKHEVKSARKLARYKRLQSGRHWAKCLLTTCYSIWFIHLPSYASVDPEKAAACLKTGYELLVKLQKLKIHLSDEVCYRVMMQLCGIYEQPGTAVKLLLQMKSSGIQPNALTYGYYNRAVLEAHWPNELSPSRLLWNKLRNVTMAVSYFRQLGNEKEAGGSIGGGSRDRLPIAGSSTSLSSLDPADRTQDKRRFAQFDKHCSRVGTIVKPAPKFHRDLAAQSTMVSAAGILITAQKRHSSAFELRSGLGRRSSCTEFNSFAAGPAAGRASDVRLRRGSMSPIEGHQLKDLVMSFANDMSILEKHNMKKRSEAAKASPRKTLTTTKESCESLDEVEEGLLPTRRNILQTKQVSQLTEAWRASEDSVASDLSGQEDTPVKRKPLWSSSEGLVADRRSEERWRFDQRAASESLDDSRNRETSPGGNYFVPRGDRSGSEDVWTASGDSSMTDVSNVDGSKGRGSEPIINGVVRSRSESSDRGVAGPVSPVRTPVTGNDPLGALPGDEEDNDLTITNRVDANNLLNKKHIMDINASTPRKSEPNIAGEDGRKRSRIESYFEDGLFSSFTDKETKGKGSKTANEQDGNKKSMQRSSTLPGAVAEVPPVVSSPSLGLNLGLASSFKFPFSRMSPSRMSLKKAELKICRTLETAISGSKKSNEILQVGISTVKSAATIMAKKFEEVISTNSTPVKSLHHSQEITNDDLDTSERSGTLDFEGWGNFKELFGDSSRKSSTTVIPDEPVADEVIRETLYGQPQPTPSCVALRLVMTTCCRCTNCAAVLHDEEIISGWSPDDSNLNTKCHFCDKSTLPCLSISIHDYRVLDKTSSRGSQLSLGNGFGSVSDVGKSNNNSNEEPIVIEPTPVPYLNPLVLRKELENILQHKGDPILTKSSFVDEHPIIYWNIVWWFKRIKVPSHLPQLLLSSNTLSKQQVIHSSWHGEIDLSCFDVVSLWDNPRLHEEVGQPMYVLWQQKELQSSLVSALVTDRNAVSRRDIAKIIAHLKMDNLKDPMHMLIKDRAKQAKKGMVQGRSLYRDILYLALVEFGRNLLDLETFEREYNIEYQKMLEEGVALQKCDKPPVSASYRNYFQPLLLLQEIS